jgi:predicted AAA+ superfamily ATPase
MEENKFPLDLLEKSNEKRIEYFSRLTIAHPKLSEAFRQVWNSIYLSKPGKVILIYGPTGVGKTTLITYLIKKITENSVNELNNDGSRVPVVSVEASMPIIGNFSWRDLFEDILTQLNEVNDGNVKIGNIGQTNKEALSFFSEYGYKSSSRYRFALEKAIKYRKPKAVLIDEAQHLTVLTSARKLLDQQNTIKSIANRTKTTHVLFGTYDLLLLQNLNGQLARRTDDVHFGRYNIENKEDAEIF